MLPFFGDYVPREFTSVDQIPAPVRAQVEEYFKLYFPKEVADRIGFRAGCEIDRTKAAETGFDQLRGLAYGLVYSVNVNGEAISSYDFLLLVNESGHALNKPELPRTRSGHELDFASKAQVEAAAKSVLSEWDDSLLEFSERYGTLVWRIVRHKKGFWWFSSSSVKVVYIDAFSGRVIELREPLVID
jgi:hypothetical protein